MTLPHTVRYKLDTNNPPTDDEAALIKVAYTQSLDNIKSIDNEITRLRDRLTALSLEQRRLSVSLEMYRGLLSPARRLLPELLQEIFCHCLPTAYSAVMSAREAPLILGRVCSEWRQIAYSTPKLWASVHIVAILSDTPSPSQKIAVALRHAISAWLSRSGALPLSISLAVRTFEPYPQFGVAIPVCNSKVRPYLDLIAPYAHRWLSINFTIYNFDWAEFLNRFRASEVPLLENFQIDGSHDCSAPQDISPFLGANSILQAPRLHLLSMPWYSHRILELGIQWQKLTGLDLGGSPFQGVIKVLGSCPNLRTCVISAWDAITQDYSQVPTGPVTSTVILQKLQTLCIYDGSDTRQYAQRVLESLITPTLRHLLLPPPVPPLEGSQPASEPDLLCGPLKSFLRHLIEPLEELNMDPYMLTDRSVVDYLLLVPGLKRLSLVGYSDSSSAAQNDISPCSRDHDRLLARLTPLDTWQSSLSQSSDDEDTRAPTCLCPKLEVLRYVNAEFSGSELLAFLRSRTVEHREHGVSHLRMVGIHHHGRDLEGSKGMGFGLQEKIRVLEKETGVRADFRYDVSEPVKDWIYSESTNSDCSPFDGLPSDPHLIPITEVSSRYYGF